MNELVEKKPAPAATDARPGAGGPAVATVGPAQPPAQPGTVAAPANAAQSVAQFGGTPSGKRSKFKFAAGTPEGDKERRDADAVRKQAARAVAAKLDAPPPIPPAAPGLVSASPAPDGQPNPGTAVQVVSDFVAWTPEDVSDFTDELVDLTEAKRVDQFVAAAKEARLPAKLIEKIEKDAHYPGSCKSGLKRAIAGVIAKWMNKSGISAKNKEEAALVFCMITIKIQGLRVRRDLHTMIEDETKKQPPAPKPAEPAAPGNVVPLVKPTTPATPSKK